jgi:hypothetical protein
VFLTKSNTVYNIYTKAKEPFYKVYKV